MTYGEYVDKCIEIQNEDYPNLELDHDDFKYHRIGEKVRVIDKQDNPVWRTAGDTQWPFAWFEEPSWIYEVTTALPSFEGRVALPEWTLGREPPARSTCRYCGDTFEAGAKFCTSCGMKEQHKHRSSRAVYHGPPF